MDKLKKYFEDRFNDLPMDGVFWSEKEGCYITEDETLVPDMDFCNDMFDAFKAGYEVKQNERTTN